MLPVLGATLLVSTILGKYYHYVSCTKHKLKYEGCLTTAARAYPPKKPGQIDAIRAARTTSVMLSDLPNPQPKSHPGSKVWELNGYAFP